MGNVSGRMSAIQSMASSAISMATIRASPSKLKSLTTVSRMAHSGRRMSLGGQPSGQAGSSRSGGRRRRSSAEHQITARITRQATRLARQRGGSAMLRRSVRLGGQSSGLQEARVHAQSHQDHNRARGAVASRGLAEVDPLRMESRLRRSVRIARQSRGRSRQSYSRRGSSTQGNGRNNYSTRR